MRRYLLAVLLATTPLCGLPASAQEADPPARVGRVAAVSGAVSFHLAGAERWERATLNLPLSDGAALWTQPGASAAIGVAGERIALDAATELDIDRLDEHSLVATQPQGDSYWRVSALPAGDSLTLRTPRGIVVFLEPGHYQVISGDTGHPTEVTVVDGAAKFTGLAADVAIAPNQTLTVSGDDPAAAFVPTLRSSVRNAFLQRMLAAERTPARHVALPPTVALMTGSEILAEEGEWGETPEEGPVWYPPAPVGFVPYRNGHWAYVAPWGWTWVDDAPWGFAPTHYGRWAEIGGRWGWIPGRGWDRPPVYAPALVAFFARPGAAGGSWVGWAPLGPREAYRPDYHASPRYLEGLNQPTRATVNVTINQRSVTIVPVAAMVNSVNVARAFRAVPPVPPTQATAFHPPVTPTRTTVGAAGAELREGERSVRPEAPGPSISPHGPIAAALLGGAAGGAAAALLHPRGPGPGLPELRPHGPARPVLPVASPAGPAVPSAPNAPLPPQSPQAHPEARAPERVPPQPMTREPPIRSESAHPTPMHPAAPVPMAAPHAQPPRPEPPRPASPRPESPRPEPLHHEPSRQPPMMRPEPPRAPPVAAVRPPPRPEPPARQVAPPRREPDRRMP